MSSRSLCATVATDGAVAKVYLSKAVAVVAVEYSRLQLVLLQHHVCFVPVAHAVAFAEETLQFLPLPCSSVARDVFVAEVQLQKAQEVRSSSSLAVHSACSFSYGVTLFRSLIGLCCCC